MSADGAPVPVSPGAEGVGLAGPGVAGPVEPEGAGVGVGPVVGLSRSAPVPGSVLVPLPSPPSVAGAEPVEAEGVGPSSSVPPSRPVSPEGVGSAGPESRWSPPPRTTWPRVVPWPPLRSLPDRTSKAVIPAMERAKTAAAASAGRFQPRSRVPWVTLSPNSSSAAGSAPGCGAGPVPSTRRSIRVRSSSAPEPLAGPPPGGGTRSMRVRASPRSSSWVRSGSPGATWVSSWVLSASGTTSGTAPGSTVGSTVVASSAGGSGSGADRRAAALRPEGVVSLVCTVT